MKKEWYGREEENKMEERAEGRKGAKHECASADASRQRS